jgi:hypothetical protein
MNTSIGSRAWHSRKLVMKEIDMKDYMQILQFNTCACIPSSPVEHKNIDKTLKVASVPHQSNFHYA